jgi:hypothetical protein
MSCCSVIKIILKFKIKKTKTFIKYNKKLRKAASKILNAG